MTAVVCEGRKCEKGYSDAVLAGGKIGTFRDYSSEMIEMLQERFKDQVVLVTMTWSEVMDV